MPNHEQKYNKEQNIPNIGNVSSDLSQAVAQKSVNLSEKDTNFNRAEQAMMYFKAELFGDEDSMGKIMRTNDPSLQKKIGRAVANYDEEVWKEKRYNIVFQLLVEKFKQNSDLKSILLNTGDKCIVECSPYDKIWGIGMGVDQYPEILDKSNWKGENLLGEILMNVRSWLRDGYANLPVEKNTGEIFKLKLIEI